MLVPLPAEITVPGLRYVSDQDQGYTRRPWGKHFRYLTHDGKSVRDAALVDRFRKLVIPPAWQRVWICRDPQGHIQVTGRDAKGRKQYIYHPAFRMAREADKFQHLLAFAKALPRLRQQVSRDMRRRQLDRQKVTATIVSLMEATLIRVGNSEYAKTNRSYGITTLRSPHVQVQGSVVRFKFRGKSGKLWNVSLTSRRAANIIRACQELPGQQLFQYETKTGEMAAISSTDVNNYLREITAMDITAKDYRTWAATVLAATKLQALSEDSVAPKKALRAVVAEVAEMLGNTAAICRKCYIHPHIQSAFLDGTLTFRARANEKREVPYGLTDEERAVMRFLQAASGKQPQQRRQRSKATGARKRPLTGLDSETSRIGA